MSDPSEMPHRELKFMPTAATFELLEPLGVGTVGAVFSAKSPDIDGPVAIKMLHPSIADDPVVVDRFQREILIMERLSHPHIVANYGGGLMDGQYFYAMQLLNHGALRERLQNNGPLSWEVAAAYAEQIASALQHAHNHGIIHRDLKSSNLFFDDDGNIVLGDFGIARDTHEADISGDGITVGTYAYMSPEQICADKHLSGQADLYSLGCVLVEMLTGKPPFVGTNFAQIWDQHLHVQPKRMSELGVDCPEWLDDLIMQLLAKKPEERPFNARAVQGTIREHLRSEFGDQASELTKHIPPLVADASQAKASKNRILICVLFIVAVLMASLLFGK